MARRIAPSTSPVHQFVAALELLVEAFEHAARLLAGVARARERDVIAALLGHDAEPALDQGEVLAVLAEQQRGEAIVVEGEHDLGRGFVGLRRISDPAIGARRANDSGSCVAGAAPARALGAVAPACRTGCCSRCR